MCPMLLPGLFLLMELALNTQCLKVTEFVSLEVGDIKTFDIPNVKGEKWDLTYAFHCSPNCGIQINLTERRSSKFEAWAGSNDTTPKLIWTQEWWNYFKLHNWLYRNKPTLINNEAPFVYTVLSFPPKKPWLSPRIRFTVQALPLVGQCLSGRRFCLKGYCIPDYEKFVCPDEVCRYNWFRCGDYCTPLKTLCNKQLNCLNGEDEHRDNCVMLEFKKTAKIVGCVTLVIFIVFVIPGFLYYRNKRKTDARIKRVMNERRSSRAALTPSRSPSNVSYNCRSSRAPSPSPNSALNMLPKPPSYADALHVKYDLPHNDKNMQLPPYNLALLMPEVPAKCSTKSSPAN